MPVSEDRQGLGPSEAESSAARRRSRARQAVYDAVEGLSEPVSLVDLSTRLGLHRNTLRGHLDALIEEGAVVRTRAATGQRGRPAWLYAARADDPGDLEEYAALAMVLASAAERSGPEAVAQTRRVGREWGRGLARRAGVARRGGAGALDGLQQVMDRLGFGSVRGDDGSLLLTRCPLLRAARAHPSVVCGVHLGLAEGMLSDGSQTPELTPFTEGGCLLRLLPAVP